jgi:hypothetical protein
MQRHQKPIKDTSPGHCHISDIYFYLFLRERGSPMRYPIAKNRGNSSPYLAQSDFLIPTTSLIFRTPHYLTQFLNSSPLPISPIKAMRGGGGQLGILVAARQQRGVISGTRWWRWWRWPGTVVAAQRWRAAWRLGIGSGQRGSGNGNSTALASGGGSAIARWRR